jgi:hypothetical protein
MAMSEPGESARGKNTYHKPHGDPALLDRVRRWHRCRSRFVRYIIKSPAEYAFSGFHNIAVSLEGSPRLGDGGTLRQEYSTLGVG